MKVIIDMQGAQTSFSKNRGVGRYTIELAKAVVEKEERQKLLSKNTISREKFTFAS